MTEKSPPEEVRDGESDREKLIRKLTEKVMKRHPRTLKRLAE